MTKTPAQKIFAAAGKAILRAQGHGVLKLTQHDLDDITVARHKLYEFMHTLTGPRPGQLKEILLDAISDVHPGKDYNEPELVLKDLADIGVTLNRLAQKRNRSSPEKIAEAKMFCDHLRHG